MTLLLVDDHQMVRLGLKSYFELQDDVEVVGEATDGAERVSADLGTPSWCVMDIVMPEVNRVDAALAILKEWPEAKILIIDFLPRQWKKYRSWMRLGLYAQDFERSCCTLFVG